MVKVLKDQFPKGTIPYQESDGYYLDGYLQSNLDYVKKNVTKNDFDAFIVVTGREGFGKSTLAAQIAKYLDPTYNLERCTFTADQFQNACVTAKKYEAVVFDETMGYLSSRGAMSKFNKRLIKIMSEMRSKNLFVILCIPNFFELDRYPALHRSTALIHIHKRGRFGSYDYKRKKMLYLKGKKTYSYSVSPNFVGRFSKAFPIDPEAYEKKKQTAIRESNKGMDSQSKMKTGFLKLLLYVYQDFDKTQEEIAEVTGYSRRYIGNLLEEARNGGLK